MSRIALVTGASSGIGKACALALLKEGWHVALAGRRAEALQAAVAEAGPEAAGRALPLPCDVSDDQAVAAMFAQVARASAAWTCSSTMPASPRAPPPPTT
jgi:NAD(P)-dependent dehydrogenase (short-subunit alcohol dehydrogenase family)